MVRLFIDLCNLFFLWVFLHVGAFFLMVVAIVYLIKSNPTPPTPIIHQHYSTVQVIEPPKRVLVEREICTRIDGCKVFPDATTMEEYCPTCILKK